jgi:hypothetical protein
MKITLSFTQDQLNIINASLTDAPYKLAAPLIADINAQIQKQFDTKADEQTPSGQTTPPNEYSGD